MLLGTLARRVPYGHNMFMEHATVIAIVNYNCSRGHWSINLHHCLSAHLPKLGQNVLAGISANFNNSKFVICQFSAMPLGSLFVMPSDVAQKERKTERNFKCNSFEG